MSMEASKGTLEETSEEVLTILRKSLAEIATKFGMEVDEKDIAMVAKALALEAEHANKPFTEDSAKNLPLDAASDALRARIVVKPTRGEEHIVDSTGVVLGPKKGFDSQEAREGM